MMLSSQIKAALIEIVGADRFKDDPVAISAHSYDAYIEEASAWAVVFPKTTEEVSAIMQVASEEKVPVTARGAGTNLSGGSIPAEKGIVLCLTQMNRIVNIAPEDRYVVVQPGVINGDLQKALSSHGYFFPPDPSSFMISTIGGNIAENAGGPRCLKYGVTVDYILGLEVVLASGKVIRMGSPNVKDVTGYRPAGLFCGSEGTLGIVTEATLKIVPAPKAVRTAMVVYNNLNDTAKTVSQVIRQGILPAAMELMDNEVINLIENHMNIGLPRDAEGILLVDVDGPEEQVEKEIHEIGHIAKNNGAGNIVIAQSKEQADELWKGRRTVYGLLSRLSPTTIVEDATVPVSKVPAMIRGCRKIAEEFDLKISIVGHAGDGNLHPTISTDINNKEEWQRVEKAIEKIFELALEMGGCLSGEHGIGLAKKSFLPMSMNLDTIEFLRTVKRSVDPDNILNPGKFV
jgi:glycolate oxidase